MKIASKHVARLTAVLSIFFVSAAWSAEAEKASAGPDAATLYKKSCSSCHGKDAKGNQSMSKAFKLTPDKLNLIDEETLAEPDEELLGEILKGKGKMPGYKGKLSEADISALVSYLRSLAPQKTSKE